MFKKLSIVIFLLILSNFLYPSSFPVYFVEKADIKIDGVNDDWPLTIPFILESDSLAIIYRKNSINEFNGKINVFFDKKYLYIYAAVLDDNLVNNDNKIMELYKGDAVMIYLGFNGSEKREYIGTDDYEINFGYHENGIRYFVKKNFIEINSIEEIKVDYKKTKNGYNLEAKIPLINLDERTAGFNEKLIIDFSIVNNKIDEKLISYLYSGEKNTWALPKYWEPIILQDDENIFLKPYILIPKKNYTNNYNRIYFWDNGVPWNGQITINDEKISTDEKGGITIFCEKPELKKIIFNNGEITLSEEIKFARKNNLKTIIEIFLNQILSPFIPLLIFIFFIFFYFYKIRKNKK